VGVGTPSAHGTAVSLRHPFTLKVMVLSRRSGSDDARAASKEGQRSYPAQRFRCRASGWCRNV